MLGESIKKQERRSISATLVQTAKLRFLLLPLRNQKEYRLLTTRELLNNNLQTIVSETYEMLELLPGDFVMAH